ncbi:MAG: type VI secretion system baseplate subunit TssF [Desulfovibrionales bacterium]|nr:type VI secretion system baseplate subunit TssF [Desulfovibrionales bacterium]
MTQPQAVRNREFYERELSYLREAGSLFARKHPSIASMLQLGPDTVPDPFTERLIESFAWLTARIQRNIDAELKDATTALLGLLYPNFTSPLPSMTIADITPDPSKKNLTFGYTIPKHTQLHCKTQQQDVSLRWRTAWDKTIYPLTISEAAFEAPAKYNFKGHASHAVSVLRLRLQGVGVPLASCRFDTLQLFLNGTPSDTFPLFDTMVADAIDVCLHDPASSLDTEPISLGAQALQPENYNEDYLLLPKNQFAHAAYQLLQEYFAFPERFLFITISEMTRRPQSDTVDILIPLKTVPARKNYISYNHFKTNAVPVVNLFSKISEPIRIDNRKREYLLVGDVRRNLSTEIHTIESVHSMVPGNPDPKPITPYFSMGHTDQSTLFWNMHRRTAGAGVPGTDVYLSFTDLDLNPLLPSSKSVYAHVLCTNRHTPIDAQAGTLLERDTDLPTAKIEMLLRPTPQRTPELEGATLWKLISQLSLNHLSLEGDQAVNALQEILSLYTPPDDPAALQQVNGILKLSCDQVTRKIGVQGWRGFVRGTGITLTIDPKQFTGSSALMFSAVLNSFFGLYANINSFTQLSIKSEEGKGVWHRWPPMNGSQPLL